MPWPKLHVAASALLSLSIGPIRFDLTPARELLSEPSGVREFAAGDFHHTTRSSPRVKWYLRGGAPVQAALVNRPEKGSAAGTMKGKVRIGSCSGIMSE